MELTDSIRQHFRLVASQTAALDKLGVHTIEDLLMHVPTRYEDVGNAISIEQLQSSKDLNEMVTIYASISNVEKKLMWKTKRYSVEAKLSDDTGSIKVRWFNQPYISDSLKYAQYVKVTGKLSGSGTSAYFANPTIEVMPGLPERISYQEVTGLYPIYKSTYGVSSRWFYYAVRKVLEVISIDSIVDPVPSDILDKYNLPSWGTAVVWAHLPKSSNDAQAARKRFAFNEVFYLQIAAAQARNTRSSINTYIINPKADIYGMGVEEFINSYPFTLTSAQSQAVDAVVRDMATGKPMARLLEGDVGSGKTAVAAAVSFVVVANKLQVAYMAPTEVLAKQLFDGFISYFKDTNIQIGLLTGSGCKKYPSKSDPTEPTKISKAQLLKWSSEGAIDIMIGTHAIIQKSVSFKHLGLSIIDEQHRFGTKQRALMLDNNLEDRTPHLLSMTATPIPRTLALTIYGDLDLSVIDEMPAGRKQIITKVIKQNKLPEVYAHIGEEINAGRQAYVICPRITPSDLGSNDSTAPSAQKLMMARLKSVTDEIKTLEKVFKDVEIGALHGKLTPTEKEEVMADFASGETKILVATSVVEVGVNVPNATIILIEGAERFGLSQLHQLRGRVLRSNHQAYCYLSTTNTTASEATRERLSAIVNAKNGFELAEMDLKLRGAGDLRGDSQWGVGDLAMEAIKNLKMVEAARVEAGTLVNTDPKLDKHIELRKVVSQRGSIHLE